jgi:predicted metal-binding membrane protein
MTQLRSYPLAKERNLILFSLLVLAAIAWALLVWQWQDMDGEHAAMGLQQSGNQGTGAEEMREQATGGQEMSGMATSDGQAAPSSEMTGDGAGMTMGLTMDMSASLYIGLWAAMMVAIMFPTAAPMILAFAKVQANRRQREQLFVPTWLFVGSYIALWSATGFLAYLVAAGGDELAQNWAWLMDNAARIGGVVLVVAGVYQLTPLKRICLSKCRTPMSYLLGSWRDGNSGAVRMGLEHGAYCLGCCWMLFVILFPLGMMNIAAMAVITAVIFAEKSLVIGPKVAQMAAIALILYGGVVIVLPSALPTAI